MGFSTFQRTAELLVAVGLAAGPVCVRAQQKPVAFIGATVMPVSGAAIPSGTVIILGGKIRAVGARAAVPPGALRIDCRGMTIIPGLIDSASSLFQGRDDAIGTGGADQNVLDTAQLTDDKADKVMASGVTTLFLPPMARGPIAGVGAVVKLRALVEAPASGRPGHARVLSGQAALRLSLSSDAAARSSLEQLSAFEGLRSSFRSARQYGESFARYERELRAYEAEQKASVSDTDADPFGEDDPLGTMGSGGSSSQPARKPTKPRQARSQEVILKALRGELPVRIEAHRMLDILGALRLADEFKLKLVLERATEGHRIANEIARRKVPVVWGPTVLAGRPRLETREQWIGTPGVLSRAGASLAISPFGVEGLESRFVLANAAGAAGGGLPVERALAAVTLGAARVLGVADRVGSLQPGKDADLVILSGSPWAPTSVVRQVWIDGEAVVRGK